MIFANKLHWFAGKLLKIVILLVGARNVIGSKYEVEVNLTQFVLIRQTQVRDHYWWSFRSCMLWKISRTWSQFQVSYFLVSNGCGWQSIWMLWIAEQSIMCLVLPHVRNIIGWNTICIGYGSCGACNGNKTVHSGTHELWWCFFIHEHKQRKYHFGLHWCPFLVHNPCLFASPNSYSSSNEESIRSIRFDSLW